MLPTGVLARFNVIMTSPRLALPAVELLERAGCAIHYMAPCPTAEAVTETDGALLNMGVMAAECIAAVLTGGAVPPERLVRS